MIIAYADPPYIGQAKKHYNCEEIDHHKLLLRLQAYDAWALSCSSTTLQEILTMPECPRNVRIAAWVKPFCIFKPNVNPAYSWEAVIFHGVRKRDRKEKTVKDHCIENITLRKGLIGAKPEKFCYWLFDLLGVLPEDEFFDLFPGTDIVTKSLETWLTSQKKGGDIL